jgi:hypothetical protein
LLTVAPIVHHLHDVELLFSKALLTFLPLGSLSY